MKNHVIHVWEPLPNSPYEHCRVCGLVINAATKIVIGKPKPSEPSVIIDPKK